MSSSVQVQQPSNGQRRQNYDDDKYNRASGGERSMQVSKERPKEVVSGSTAEELLPSLENLGKKMTGNTPQPKPSTSTSSTTPGTLILTNTQPIRSFLSSSSSSNLPDDLIQSALSLSSEPSVPYKSLRSIWVASDPATRPPLSRLLDGSSFIFTSPKPRQKSEELKARLRKLEELAERKAYAELVKDITPKEATNEPFFSYKDQLGFGLHVIVTMFTGFLIGYVAFRALFGRNPIMSVAGGVTGLIVAMLVETFLFIIKTSDYNERSFDAKPTSNLRFKKTQ